MVITPFPVEARKGRWNEGRLHNKFKVLVEKFQHSVSLQGSTVAINCIFYKKTRREGFEAHQLEEMIYV